MCKALWECVFPEVCKHGEILSKAPALDWWLLWLFPGVHGWRSWKTSQQVHCFLKALEFHCVLRVLSLVFPLSFPGSAPWELGCWGISSKQPELTWGRWFPPFLFPIHFPSCSSSTHALPCFLMCCFISGEYTRGSIMVAKHQIWGCNCLCPLSVLHRKQLWNYFFHIYFINFFCSSIDFLPKSSGVAYSLVYSRSLMWLEVSYNYSFGNCLLSFRDIFMLCTCLLQRVGNFTAVLPSGRDSTHACPAREGLHCLPWS